MHLSRKFKVAAKLCAYNDKDFGGGLLYTRSTVGWSNFQSNNADLASSLANWVSGHDGAFYTNASLSGGRYCLGPSTNVAWVGSSLNDAMSSAITYSGLYYC